MHRDNKLNTHRTRRLDVASSAPVSPCVMVATFSLYLFTRTISAAMKVVDAMASTTTVMDEQTKTFVDALFLADRRTPRPCSTGLGVCRRTGVILCGSSGVRTECSALAGEPEAAVDDTCNGRDEDCDGEIDEDYVDIVVNIGDSEIFAFEASRPGATAMQVGIDENAEGEVIT